MFASCLAPSTGTGDGGDPGSEEPPPAPSDVRIAYDTVAGTVRISWSPVGAEDLEGYLVYRSAAGSDEPSRINASPVRDTFYVDDVERLSDTSDLHLTYRVKAQNRDAVASRDYSDPVSVGTLVPLRARITIPDTVAAGDTIHATGFARSGIPLTFLDVSVRIRAGAGAAPGFQVTFTPPPAGSKRWDMGSDARLRIATGPADSDVECSLRYEIRAGGRILVDSMPFVLRAVGAEERTVSAGAQANAALGSSIDIDPFRSHFIVPAQAIAGEIDLILAFSTSLNAMAIYSPHAAKNGVGAAGGFSFMQDMNPVNATEIRTTVVRYEDVRTRAQVDSLWNAGKPVAEGRLPISTGMAFLAKSNQGRIVLLQASGLTESSSGKADFRGKAGF
jgi:hypothetical protein